MATSASFADSERNGSQSADAAVSTSTSPASMNCSSTTDEIIRLSPSVSRADRYRATYRFTETPTPICARKK
jgi:hypothetical protein